MPRKPRSQRASAALFLAPFFALFGLFTLAPIAYTAYLSLFSERGSGLGFGGTTTVFVGLDNFTTALGDKAFRDGFVTIAVYCAVYIPLLIVIALGLSLLLDSIAARAKRFFQLALYLPNLAPGLIAAIIWLYLYTPGISPVIDLLEKVGLTWDNTSSTSAILSITNVALWEHTGYNVVIFFAALQAIPREVLEASTVDGAGPIRTALRVKAPMIRGAVVLSALFTVVGAVQLFTEPKLISTRASAINYDWTPTMYIYQEAFSAHNYGLAAASSLLLAVFVGLASFLVTRLSSRKSA